jgi:transcriptional regulator NrdR family protein
MWCPSCDKPTQVIDTRKYRDITDTFDFVQRQRVCRECGHKFSSIEIPQETWDKTYKLPKRFREDS